MITGASRGIGRALARTAAADGARVGLIARPSEDLAALAHELGSSRARALPADVSRPDEVDAALDAAWAWLGEVGCVVHCAATPGPVGPLVQLDPTAWEESLAVNLGGALAVARGAARRMAPRGGLLVLATSGLAAEPVPRLGAYAVAKAGVELLARVLSVEERDHGLRVELYDPGMVDTDMHAVLRAMDPEELGPLLHAELVALHAGGGLRPPTEVGVELWRLLGQWSPGPSPAPAPPLPEP